MPRPLCTASKVTKLKDVHFSSPPGQQSRRALVRRLELCMRSQHAEKISRPRSDLRVLVYPAKPDGEEISCLYGPKAQLPISLNRLCSGKLFKMKDRTDAIGCGASEDFIFCELSSESKTRTLPDRWIRPPTAMAGSTQRSQTGAKG